MASSSRLLSRIIIESPCTADWNEMDGDLQKRFCGSCKKHVYNLSEMDAASAEVLLRSNSELCVRLYRRPDGTVLTKECRTGMRKRWTLASLRSALAIAFATILSLRPSNAFSEPQAKTTPEIQTPIPSDTLIQGGMALREEIPILKMGRFVHSFERESSDKETYMEQVEQQPSRKVSDPEIAR